MSKASSTFIHELRRRRVLPVAGAYIAIAWLVIEIAEFLLNQAAAPGWILRLLAIIFVVGFPVATVLSWVIQRQPDGGWAVDSSKGQNRIVIGAMALGIVTTTVLAWLILPHMEEADSASDYQLLPYSLAIMPLETAAGTPNERTMARALVSALVDRLEESDELILNNYSKLQEPQDNLESFGRDVRAMAVLSGRILQEAEGYQVHLDLLDVTRNSIAWSQTVYWDPSRIPETGAFIANEVLRWMGLPLLSQAGFLETDKLDAWDAWLEGAGRTSTLSIEKLRLAMADYQRAIDLDPTYVRAYLGLAEAIHIYLITKGPSEAERQALKTQQRELVDTAYRLDENSAQVFSMMGLLAEDRELRVEMFQRALELDPYDARTYFRLGHARYGEGNYEEVERLWRRAVEFNPGNANYQSDLAMVLWQVGRHDEAVAALNRSIELDPRMTHNYQKLATWNMFYYGRIDEAIINGRKAYALDPEIGYHAAGVATNYRHLSMWPEAKSWVDRALELSPTHAWVWLLAGYVYRSDGDEETAMDHYHHSLKLTPGLSISLLVLASWDIAAGRWAEARERWQAAYPEFVGQENPTLNRDNIQAAIRYAMNLEEAGFEDEAQQLLNKCLVVVNERLHEADAEQDRAWILSLINRGQINDREETLADLKEQIVDNRQRAEIDLAGSEYDFLRDDPHFQELERILEDDLAEQRSRIREMERNGEMPPAPGVELPEM